MKVPPNISKIWIERCDSADYYSRLDGDTLVIQIFHSKDGRERARNERTKNKQ